MSSSPTIRRREYSCPLFAWHIVSGLSGFDYRVACIRPGICAGNLFDPVCSSGERLAVATDAAGIFTTGFNPVSILGCSENLELLPIFEIDDALSREREIFLGRQEYMYASSTTAL